MSETHATQQPVTTPEFHPTAKRLRLATIITLVLVGLQVVLGGALASQMKALAPAHAGIGYLLMVASIVCAVFAVMRAKVTGKKGIMFHALSIPVLVLVQIGLGEMANSNGALTLVHIALGLGIAVAIGSLFAMSTKGTAADDDDL